MPSEITIREIICVFHPQAGAIDKILNEQSHITNFEAFFQHVYGFGLDTKLAPVNERQAQERS